MYSAAVEISGRKINIVGLEREPNFLKYRIQSIYGGNSNEYLFIFTGYALKTNASSVGGIRIVNKRLCFTYVFIFIWWNILFFYYYLIDFWMYFGLLYVSEKN